MSTRDGRPNNERPLGGSETAKGVFRFVTLLLVVFLAGLLVRMLLSAFLLYNDPSR